MRLEITDTKSLSPSQRDQIVSRLTNTDSEFQQRLRANDGSSSPIALVCDEGGSIVAWATSHRWREYQTLEAFTDESQRRRGLAVAASAALAVATDIFKDTKVAVFSPVMRVVAERAEIESIHEFSRHGDDWLESDPSGGSSPH